MDIFFSVLIVNLAIFLPIQIIAYFLLAFYIIIYPFYNFTLFFVLICLKWLFYRFQFQKLFEGKSINKGLSLKKITKISILTYIPLGLLINIYTGIVILLEILRWPELYL
jgi:hypothetical protein